MKRNELRTLLLTLGVLLAIATSSVAQMEARKPAGASSPGHTKTQAAGEQSSNGPHEGIKVHGHWTIVIKNPDGSVASRHEFENSLVGTTGADALAQLLARTATPGAWEIILSNSPTTGGSPCGNVCVMFEGGTGFTGDSTNLTVSYVPNPGRTVLQGSLQASVAGAIAGVSTYYFACAPSVNPAACLGWIQAGNSFGVDPFTQRALTAPIAVQSGQIVQVTVTFTFS